MSHSHESSELTLDETPRVVVGVDGSPANRSAVMWAAYYAHRIGLPLELVHIVDEAVQTSPYFTPDEIKAAAGLAIAPAAEEVKVTYPDLPVTVQTMYGHPARTLRRVSSRATLLVVGRRGHGGFTRMLLGSVSAAVANHAAIPTVVVPKDWDVLMHAHEPIVVGFDGSPGSDAALRLAMDTLVPPWGTVHLVHAWGEQLVFLAETMVAHGGVDNWQGDAAALVKLAAEPWRLKHPDIKIVEEIPQGHVSGCLTRESERAQILLVGAHPASRLHAFVVGSTTNNVLYHAHCPVIVVPAPSDEF